MNGSSSRRDWPGRHPRDEVARATSPEGVAAQRYPAELGCPVTANPDPVDSPKLRVCLVATHFAEYGYALAESLAPHADVLVVASEENTRMEIGRDFIEKGFEGQPSHLLYRTRDPLSIVRQGIRLARAVRRFKPDVIHIQEDSKDVLAFALPFLTRVPVILTMHDPKPHQGPDTRDRTRTRHGLYIAQLRRRVDAVIVHGQRLVADAREVLTDDRVTIDVVPHGPLGQRLAQRQPHEAEVGRCLFFGRIQAYKGLETFIASIRLLRQAGLPARGVIAGTGPALEPWRSELEGSEDFELIERFLSAEEAVQEFQRAEVVLLPYREATQSGVAAFAMGVGRPVVAFDVGALRDSVDDGRTGLLAPSGDVEAFVSAATRVLSDAELRRRLGEGALAQGRGSFSWTTIASSHIAIYRRAHVKRRSLARSAR
jgi:glycosyltransferase involved in cell wall biosynthesis